MNYRETSFAGFSETEDGATLKNQGGHLGGGSETLRIDEIPRRLTPTECERLQGFPDGWTQIGHPELEEVPDYRITYDDDYNIVEKVQIGTHKELVYYYIDEDGKRKKVTDSARYKALGNSIGCGPASYWQYLVKRISAQYTRPATLGSLFDGIGGFPICWARVNGVSNCKWASEIEPFPIAVTKQHFGENGDFYKIMEKQGW